MKQGRFVPFSRHTLDGDYTSITMFIDLRYGALLGGKNHFEVLYYWFTLIRTTWPSKPPTGVCPTSFTHVAACMTCSIGKPKLTCLA